MTEAVVYIPDDLDRDDGLLARRGVAHIERRGYRFAGVVRTWKHVLDLAALGAIVVFACQEHAAAVSRWKVKREFVGEETCGLVPFMVNGEVIGRPGGAAAIVNEISAYRSGYADGFVDSATLRTAKRRQGWRG